MGYEVDTTGNLVYRDAGGAICASTDPGAHLTMQRIYVNPNYFDVSISSNGQVVGLDSATSTSTVLGQIILATFAIPIGLEKGRAGRLRNDR
jgi:hypothetical protein